MKVYLATGNSHKLEELREILSTACSDLDVLPPSAVGGMPDVVEDQDTFTGNALKKARALASVIPPHSLALADDSGLCVDALEGAPGVYSARYAGEKATDADNTRKLLAALEGLEPTGRSASFQCHLAVVSSLGEERVFEGSCLGTILEEPRGVQGFGYDPVFAPDGFEKTFAELSGQEKAELSHRGHALRQLVDWLRRD